MTPTLAVGVVHASWSSARRAMLIDQERQMGGRVVIHRETEGYYVSKDLARNGSWPPAKAAWNYVRTTNATHGLVINDDAIPCKDFLQGVKAAITEKPNEMICYWSMRRSIIGKAQAESSSWFTSADAAMGIAISMPITMVRDFLKWQALHVDPSLPGDDRRICLYLVYGAKRRLWTTVPSLVEHGAPSDSLIGNGNSRRVATTWLGDTSALTVDWSRGADRPPHDSQRTIGHVTMAGYRP